ncbi:MAG TPA: glycosyltransferase family 39 protein, partial [Lacunisphaera sp.]|nr:glycosyltransferase family 39 protein [Lacunisphaera sp.]
MSPPVASQTGRMQLPLVRVALFALTAAAALYFGFLHFPVPAALNLVRNGGYYVILLTFVLWLGTLWRLRASPGAGAPVQRKPGDRLLAAGVIGFFTVLALCHETFRSKILFDEYVLQSTAYNLHFFRDNSAMVRGYDIQGVFLSTDSYVDKRPVFFAFLLSLVHDVTGYRPGNVFVLNAGLFMAVLALVWRLGERLNGRRGALLATGLLGSLPLLAQNATGAGMELLNLGMLLLVIWQAAQWLERPDEAHLSAFVLSVILLVQSRYESALYALPVAGAILLGWWRVRRVVVSWAVIAAPLLFIPVALQQKIISNTPAMWELRENQTSRFSVDYLEGNLAGAWKFFSSYGITHANSLLLGPLGFLALFLVGCRL